MKKHEIRSVLIAGKAYAPHIGGIETVMKQTAEYLRKYAKIKVLCCRSGIGLTIHEKINGVRVTYAGSFGQIASCPLSLSYFGEFRRKVMLSDAVELHLPFPPLDLALLLAGYRGRVIAVWHCDIVRQKVLLRLCKPLLRHTLKRADVILCATDALAENSPYLRDFRDKCVTIPYGIDPKEYDRRPKLSPLSAQLYHKNAKKILFTGRLVYYKGLDILLEAFAQVDPQAELFLAGAGILSTALKEQARRLGLTERVHFLGRRLKPELKDMFADCDIFVLPSSVNSEAFGIVQLEAMVYGKPVINTALPTGVPQVSIDGETGLTVPPGDAAALAKAINTLLRDDALRARLGAAARERVLREFSLEHAMEQTAKCILE